MRTRKSADFLVLKIYKNISAKIAKAYASAILNCFSGHSSVVFQPVQHAGLQRVQAGAILAVGVGVLGVGSVDLLLGGGDVLGIGHGLEIRSCFARCSK